MSTFHQTPINEFTHSQYTSYLQDQLEKLSSFMLYQKKENQKNHHLIRMIEGQNQKIKMLNDKVLLIQLYQNENLRNQQKLSNQIQKTHSLQKRLSKLQDLNSLHKLNPSQTKSHGQFNLNRETKELIMFEIDDKMKSMYEQLCGQISQLEHNLTKKINILYKDKQVQRKENIHTQQLSKKSISKANMTPGPTNYTQSDKSRLREFDKSEDLSKKNPNHIEKRINSFVNQKNSKKDLYYNPNNQDSYQQILNSLKISQQIMNAQQRSPISSYLSKQNEHANKQSTNLNKQITSKSFYSDLQSQSQNIVKKKDKKSRSRSRSQQRSNRSISISKPSKSKSKDQQLCDGIKLKKNASKHSNPQYIKGAITDRIIKKKQSVIKKGINKANKQSKRDQRSRTSISIKQDKPLQRKKLKLRNQSKISEFQLSYASNNSRSRSKSLPKQSQNQKKYLLCCEKFH